MKASDIQNSRALGFSFLYFVSDFLRGERMHICIPVHGKKMVLLRQQN